MKEEFQKEYESYMKKVTDGFVEIQPIESLSFPNGRIPYKVNWSGGLDYELDLNYDILLISRSDEYYEKVKIHNSETANRYLKSNTLTYKEWIEKYKQHV